MLQYDCPESGCAFRVRAATEYEVFDAVETHARDRHGVWLSGRAIREHVSECDAVD